MNKKLLLSLAAILCTFSLFAQSEWGGVKGTVVNRAGRVAVPGASVVLSQNGQNVASAQADAEGKFLVEGLTNGIYDEDLKMTVLALKEDINARPGRKTIISVMVDENDCVVAGADLKGMLSIGALTEGEAQSVYHGIKKALTPPRPFTVNMAALVIAMLFFICFTLKS